MEKIWLKSYSPGVPAEINPDHYSSLIDMFEESCRKYRDSPAFYSLGVTLTYQEIDFYSRAFAAYLQTHFKLKKGDRVALMMPNVLQYPIALFGALRLGLTIVNVNPLYTVPELVHQLKDAGAETIIVLENFAHTVEDALSEIKLKNIIVTQVGDLLPPFKAKLIQFFLKYIRRKIPAWTISNAISFKKILEEGEKLNFSHVEINNTDIAFLQYTGGTTGVAKGAMLTHRNILSNIEQATAWFHSLLTPGKEIIITALPLYHIFSLTANSLFFFKLGGLNVLIANPRNLPDMISEMKKFKFTGITGVNTLFNGLLHAPAFSKLDFSHLKLTLGGGMAVQRAVAEKWQAVTKEPLLEAYGLTETSPCVTINPVNLHSYNGTIGLPVPSTDVCFLDEDEKEVPLGKAGELAVKGPQVMSGYWNNPNETAKAFTKDGWFLTGDIAAMDEKGFVRILERKKDMILVSGFNVYPSEVEDVLTSMPGIAEAAVVGVYDENSTEAVKAFIVATDPAITKEDVIHFAKKSLTGYKVPKYVEFCKELPKTNVGKILRRALR